MKEATADRRPIKTRSWRIFQSLAAWLARSGISPNAISVASVFFAAIGAIGLMATAWAETDIQRRLCWLMASAGIQLRLIANLLDGMVAVEGGRSTPDGAFWNELPDRWADILILAGAGLAGGGARRNHPHRRRGRASRARRRSGRRRVAGSLSPGGPPPCRAWRPPRPDHGTGRSRAGPRERTRFHRA